MFYVYVIFNAQTNHVYVGFTSNLQNRLDRHNQLIKNSNKNSYTRRFPADWKYLYVLAFPNKNDALKAEKSLKSGNGTILIEELMKEATAF